MIVVTGATGNIGRHLVRTLASAGERVTAVSRRAADLPDGVRHRQADLGRSESLRPVLEGAAALFLLIAGEQLVTGASPHAILDDAKAAGVGRVVLLSSQAVATRPEFVSHARLREFEDALRQAGPDWTILRPGGFASNAFAWCEPIRAHRTAAAPFGDVGLPIVDPADIAEVAAAALREPGHAGRTYELTGPVAVTPRERATAIGEALGEPVRFVEQSREEARAQMSRFMPEVVVEGTLAILGEPTDGERRVSPDVERVLGRAPRTFAEWAGRNIAAFR
ncbi:NAD-dependent epimerase/dehydratase family protein [Sphaerisporangium album]|uniref:NAD-dependent epimerase/dehydratase family protein n=1 Tax=Sphaerisporangium album TaxID=509200 RepID=A0A367FG57_9ACTN|nr:NAD(P)H-binding protein [Sphaerisporangium album]RCG28645.1 NAD-dependent epimerase/dehydratase family protein [Sphaerisporangium album]